MLEAFIFLSGRLGRLAYFGYSILFAIVLGLIAALLILPARNSPSGGTVLIVAVIIIGVIAFWGGIALSVKRLHDWTSRVGITPGWSWCRQCSMV